MGDSTRSKAFCAVWGIGFTFICAMLIRFWSLGYRHNMPNDPMGPAGIRMCIVYVYKYVEGAWSVVLCYGIN